MKPFKKCMFGYLPLKGYPTPQNEISEKDPQYP